MDSPPPVELHDYIGGHPLVAKVLAQRGILSSSEAGGFLDPRLYRPAAALDLPNLEQAVERIVLAIRKQGQVCVWGDFDVDGQTATTLLVSTLRALGANVRHHIPVRGRESHGMKLEVVKEVVASGVQMILTCDTGIAEHEAIAYAQRQGVDVVVTDHHTLPDTLPTAHALVNPQMLEPDHPLRHLPGVGVVYKLAEELFRRAGREGEAETLLDLVALGIVADVAFQQADTRYLLQRGLEVLRNTDRLGLHAMFKLADLNPAYLSEEHIGFAIAPRLNALGRLGDANPIVEFLTTKDLTVAEVVAQQLESLNAERKLLTSQIYQAALAQIEADPSLLDFAVLVMAHPTWEAGVLGIVAGRLVERFHRPVVLLVESKEVPTYSHESPPSPPTGFDTLNRRIARGSARSVEGVNITEAIAAQRELLLSFGGHPMAAGVSLEAERIPAFRRGLSEVVEAMRGSIEAASLRIDAFLPLSELSLALVEEIGRLAPFGAGNPPLTLASRHLIVKDSTVIGRTREHLQVFVEDELGEVQKIFWWQGAENPLPEGRFDLAYTVRASDYRGERQMQIAWVEARPVEMDPIEVPATQAKGIEWVDFRQEMEGFDQLRALQARGVQIWAEGEVQKAMGGIDRLALVPAKEFVILSSPPGPREWKWIMERVNPEKVYVVAFPSEADKPDTFLKKLAGLLKFSLRTNKTEIEIEKLAAALGHREKSVQTGVEWLAEKGLFDVVWFSSRDFRVQSGHGVRGQALQEIEKRLAVLLDETIAYQRFFRKASLQRLEGSLQ